MVRHVLVRRAGARVVAALGLLAASAAGCDGGSVEAEFTEDIRVDGGGDADSIDNSNTRMCVAPDGTVYILWLDDSNDPGGKRDIWLNRGINRGGEGEDGGPTPESFLPQPVRVNQGDGDVWNPDLFCNEVGVYVVWEDDRDGELQNHQIYFNSSVDQGETWMADDVLIENDPSGNSMSLEPKITGRGTDLYVTWYDNLNGTYDILFSSPEEAGGTTWRQPIRIDSDVPAGSSYSAHPEIAVSQNGQDVWIAWEDSRNVGTDIYVAHSSSHGTEFDLDRRVDGGDPDGASNSFEPKVCTDGASQVYVTWHDARGGETAYDIYANYSGDAGTNWSASAIRLDTDAPGFSNSLSPQCVFAGGEAHIAWEDRRSQNYDVYYRSLVSGIPGPEIRADAGTPLGQSNSVEVAIAANDTDVAIAWQDDRAAADGSTYDDLFYNLSQAGGPFSSYEEDDANDDFRIDSMYDGQSFKVDLNFQILGGEWYAAWTDGRGGSADVYFQRRALGEETTPPKLEDLEGQQAE